MGGKVAMLFATRYPEMVDKLIIADIGPRYYRQHHSDILAGLNAVDFSQKPDRNQVDGILKNYVTDFGTRQFLMKNLYWVEPGQLGFRFNLAVFNEKNPQRDVVKFTLGPRYGKPAVSTRIRLATTQKLVAVAQMSDGSFWSHTVDVIVTLAACIEGDT